MICDTRRFINKVDTMQEIHMHTHVYKEEKHSPSINPTEDLTPLRTPFYAQDDPIHIIRVFIEEPSEELEVGRL